MNTNKDIFSIAKKLIFLVIIFQLAGCASIYQSQKKKMNTEYREGVGLYKKGKYQEALDKFQSVINIEPGHGGARQYLIMTKEAMKKVSDDHYQKGIAYKKAGRYEESLDQFLFVQQKDPDYKDTKKQIEALRESKQLKRKFTAQMKTAYRLQARKQYREAYTRCLNAEKLDPSNGECSTLKGRLETSMNDRAKPHLRKAEDLFDKKKYRDARTYAARALDANPWNKDAKALLDKCNYRITMGDLYANAKEKYAKGDSLGSYDLFLQVDSIEKGYLDTGVYLEKLKAQLGRRVGEFFERGVALYDKEQFKEAIGEFNKVLRIDSEHKRAKEYRERAMAKMSIKDSLGDD